MKKYSKVTPAELMLIEVTLAEYNEAVNAAEAKKKSRLSSIAASHPEAKNFSLEVVNDEMCLAYDDGAEDKPSVPPEKKPRKVKDV